MKISNVLMVVCLALSCAISTCALAEPVLGGDYNNNNTVDAADYTVWRDAFIAQSSALVNDPTPGTVTESDFNYWRDNFGSAGDGGAGSVSTVPEPTTLLMLFTGALGLAVLRRRSRPR